jgi:hypothetical protein
MFRSLLVYLDRISATKYPKFFTTGSVSRLFGSLLLICMYSLTRATFCSNVFRCRNSTFYTKFSVSSIYIVIPYLLKQISSLTFSYISCNTGSSDRLFTCTLYILRDLFFGILFMNVYSTLFLSSTSR